jgi:transcriptional regulator of acetoin/glycerol metabolism
LADLPFDCRPGPRPAEPEVPPPETDSLNALARAERQALLRELELDHGNISHVARKLGVSRNTLYRKMHRLGIELPIKKPLH